MGYKNTSQLNEDFIKIYDEGSNEGFVHEVDVLYIERLHEFHNDLPFPRESMKIGKVENLVANFCDEEKCVLHIRNLKQTLNRGLVLIIVYSH